MLIKVYSNNNTRCKIYKLNLCMGHVMKVLLKHLYYKVLVIHAIERNEKMLNNLLIKYLKYLANLYYDFNTLYLIC